MSSKQRGFILTGYVVGAIIAFIFLSACYRQDSEENKVVVRIGETNITERDLIKEIKRVTLEMGIPDLASGDLTKPLLNRIIERYLILEYGREKGITIPEDELTSAVNEIKGDYSEEDFKEILLHEYIDFNEWKERLRGQLLIKKITSKASESIGPISFEEIKSYFEAHPDEFKKPPMIRLRQIVVRTKQEADQIKERLDKGEDMGKLARQYSIAPEAANGGELGWVARGGLEKTMENVAFSLRVNTVSPVTETPYGFHIFEVLSKNRGGSKSLPEARREIESKLMYEKEASFYSEWIKTLRRLYPVEVDEQTIKNMELG